MRLLAWPAVDAVNRVSDVFLGEPVLRQTADNTTCNTWLTVAIPQERAGTNQTVRPIGSQDAIPPKLRSSTVGGVVITTRTAATVRAGTWIDAVDFSGRVLYPNDPAAYAAYAPGTGGGATIGRRR